MASHLGDTTSDNKQTKKILSEGALQQIISQGALQQIVPHRALYSRSFLIGAPHRIIKKIYVSETQVMIRRYMCQRYTE